MTACIGSLQDLSSGCMPLYLAGSGLEPGSPAGFETDALPSETLCGTGSFFDQWLSEDYFLLDSTPPVPSNSVTNSVTNSLTNSVTSSVTNTPQNTLLESPLLQILPELSSMSNVANPVLFEALSSASLGTLTFNPLLERTGNSSGAASPVSGVYPLRLATSASSLVKRELDLCESLPPEIALKRRRKPTNRARKLPEPAVNETNNDDPQAEKRRKNTDAARRSRLRKTLRMDLLEERVAVLEAENTQLHATAAVAVKDSCALRAQNAEYAERVRTLEQQLSESYKLLLGKLKTAMA